MKPTKIGLYKCKWSDGGTYYNYFDGKDWCWGMSVLHGEQNAIGRLGAALLNDQIDSHILTPINKKETPEEYELVVDLEGGSNER